MRKILLSILLALLVIVAGLTMKNGISLGSLHILGFQDIAEENQELTTAIEKAKSKEEEYSNEVLPKLSADTSKLATAKKVVLDTAKMVKTEFNNIKADFLGLTSKLEKNFDKKYSEDQLYGQRRDVRC